MQMRILTAILKSLLRIKLCIRSDLSVGLINKRTNNSRWYTILQRKNKEAAKPLKMGQTFISDTSKEAF